MFFLWLAVNDQIEYSNRKSMEPIPPDSLPEVKQMRRQLRSVFTDDLFENCKKVFFLFDEDKNGLISRSEAQRGIAYLEVEGFLIAPSRKTVDGIFDTCLKMRPSPARDIESGTNKKIISEQLRFVDFVRLYLTLKAASNSVVATARLSQAI